MVKDTLTTHLSDDSQPWGLGRSCISTWGLPHKEEAEKDMRRPENISQAKAAYREKFIDANVYAKLAQRHNTAVYNTV